MQKNTLASDSNQKWVVGGVLAVTVLVLGVALYLMKPSNKVVVTITDPSILANVQTGKEPWIAEKDGLKSRLNAIGLPALKSEGTAFHIHQHLDLIIEGKPVAVSPTLGINETVGFISPIHSHDNRGVIHVESPVIQDFTLGQFFDVWGVTFTESCVGGYCMLGDKVLRVYINGALHTGDPRAIVLTAHQQIAVTYGTEAQLPTPIPASFTFSPNE